MQFCGQHRAWSACANAQADLGLRCPLTLRINGYCSICLQTENDQIRLHTCSCARSSGPSLFAYGIRACFARCASYVMLQKKIDRMV